MTDHFVRRPAFRGRTLYEHGGVCAAHRVGQLIGRAPDPREPFLTRPARVFLDARHPSPPWMSWYRGPRARQGLARETGGGGERGSALQIRHGLRGPPELDQREAEIQERADVPRIVAARALELAARFRELALLSERESQAGPGLGVARL